MSERKRGNANCFKERVYKNTFGVLSFFTSFKQCQIRLKPKDDVSESLCKKEKEREGVCVCVCVMGCLLFACFVWPVVRMYVRSSCFSNWDICLDCTLCTSVSAFVAKSI